MKEYTTPYITISPDEAQVLKEAEDILDKICAIFVGRKCGCDSCPLNTPCKGIKDYTPSGMIYASINGLKVEDDD